MIQELREYQVNSGVIFNQAEEMIESFGNDDQALGSVQEGVIVCDRSHWGLLQLTGEDRQRFLHNQTTNNINHLQPGQGCNTVFVNSTGRTLDLVTAYLTEDSILLLVSPNRRQFLIEWMDRYLFPMDKVEIKDITDENVVFTLLGEKSNDLLKQLAIDEILDQPNKNHLIVTIENKSFRITVDSGLAIPGYTLIVPNDSAVTIWKKLINLEAIPAGDRVWQTLRIQQGRPFPNQELTEDYNPLEAGLWDAISFDKGCYIGQETIARLNTYQGVKQRLWGIKLTQSVDLGTPIMIEGNKVGVLTSCTKIEQEFIGLGYVKTKAGGAGLKVKIGEVKGELISVPFLTHDYYQPK